MISRNDLGPVLLLSLLALGCTPQPPPYQPALQRQGQLYLYLQPLPQEAHRLTLHLAAISALREDGGATPLELRLSDLRGDELMDGQRLLASATLPPGDYRGLSLWIDEASVRNTDTDTTAALLVPDEPLQIDQAFRINRKAASTLFLTLHPGALVSAGFRFTPDFSLAKPSREVKRLLGFATSSTANLVSVFNKHTMEIVDNIATSSGPAGAVVDSRRGWVYVALAGDDAIEAIEANNRVILRWLQLNFGDEPVEVALSYDRRYLVSANSGTNSASIIDAGSLSEVSRVPLPSRPTSVVTSPISAHAFLVQPQSQAVSAIDLSQRDLTATRILEETPTRGAISPDGGSLFLISRYSSDLLVLDTTTLTVQARIHVGRSASFLRVDPNTGLVYVGLRSGGISVVDPSSLTAIDRIRVDGNAAYFDIDGDENSLFVLIPERRTVQKIDLVSKRVRGAVEIAEGGYAVAVMGAR